MRSEDVFRKELEEEPEKLKKRKKKKKVLQEPKISVVARERARIAAERNANVKAK